MLLHRLGTKSKVKVKVAILVIALLTRATRSAYHRPNQPHSVARTVQFISFAAYAS